MKTISLLIVGGALLGCATGVLAQTSPTTAAQSRGGSAGAPSAPASVQVETKVSESGPTLLFEEKWTRAPMAQPMLQANLGNQHLILHAYGDTNGIRKTYHPTEDYTYTGETKSNWALTVSDPKNLWDLTGNAKIMVRTRNSGYRFTHVVIKTADGRYYASEEGSGESSEWMNVDYVFSTLHWRSLLMVDRPTNASNRRQPDPNLVPIIPQGKATPELSRVEEVGFSDLMPGGWIPATTRVNSFALYGKNVPIAAKSAAP